MSLKDMDFEVWYNMNHVIRMVGVSSDEIEFEKRRHMHCKKGWDAAIEKTRATSINTANAEILSELDKAEELIRSGYRKFPIPHLDKIRSILRVAPDSLVPFGREKRGLI